MTAQYIGWALVVGLVIGGALVWFAIGRLPRSAEEMTAEERAVEASWISDTISDRGGLAPVDLVEEILELHTTFLEKGAGQETVEIDGGLPPTSPSDEPARAGATRPEGEPPDR
jgi:hypothetical protein